MAVLNRACRRYEAVQGIEAVISAVTFHCGRSISLLPHGEEQVMTPSSNSQGERSTAVSDNRHILGNDRRMHIPAVTEQHNRATQQSNTTEQNHRATRQSNTTEQHSERTSVNFQRTHTGISQDIPGILQEGDGRGRASNVYQANKNPSSTALLVGEPE